MSSPAATAPSINFRGSVVQNGTGEYDINLTVISVQGSVNWEDLNIIAKYPNGTDVPSGNIATESGAIQAGDIVTIHVVNVNSGDTVKVTIIHTPSNSVIYENTFTIP